MQRMSRGPDQWQLIVHRLHSLNNDTARDSDQESFQSRKHSSTHVEKRVFLGNQKIICFFADSFRENQKSFLFKKPFFPFLLNTNV